MLCPHCKKKKIERREEKKEKKSRREENLFVSHRGFSIIVVHNTIFFLLMLLHSIADAILAKRREMERERVIRGKGRKVNLSIAIYIHIHSLPHKHSPPYHPHWRWDVGCACGRWLSKSRLIYRRHWGRVEGNCVVPWYSHAMHVRSGKMAKTVKLMILLFAWHFFAFLFNLLLLIIISRSISLLSSPKGKHLIANVHV